MIWALHTRSRVITSKLTVDVPTGSQGAAYSKFKVFWVKDCAAPNADADADTDSRRQPPSPHRHLTPTHTPEPTPTPTKATAETPAPVPTAVPGGANGAGGGSGAGLLGLVLAGGAVAGTAAIARRRFLHDS